MNRRSVLIAAAVGTLLAAGNASRALADHQVGKEKCYGVVLAGKNDCATPVHSCQGEAKKDRDAKEWIYLSKGTWERIAGAALSPARKVLKPEPG